MRKTVLTFGLVAGGILSVAMLATLPFMDRIGFDNSMIVGYSTMVLAFLLIYFGVRSYRDNVAGGHVTFGRAFAVGILITLVASACYVATWEFIYYRITPDFVDKCAAYSIEKERSAGASPDEIATLTQKMETFKEMYKNPLFNVAFTLIEPLPVGLLFTLVTAGVLSRRRRDPGTLGAGNAPMTGSRA